MSHKTPSTRLAEVTPESLVNFSSNELIELWKDKHGLDIWAAIGEAACGVRDNKKIRATDRLNALIKVGELALRIKRAGASEKGGAVTVQVVTVDPRKEKFVNAPVEVS